MNPFIPLRKGEDSYSHMPINILEADIQNRTSKNNEFLWVEALSRKIVFSGENLGYEWEYGNICHKDPGQYDVALYWKSYHSIILKISTSLENLDLWS